MSSYTAKDLAALARQAEQISRAISAKYSAQTSALNQQQKTLENNRTAALRQAYLTREQALTQLPEQLTAAGINGGLAETSQVQLNRSYGNRRGQIQQTYADGMAQLALRRAQVEAQQAQEQAQDAAAYQGAVSALQEKAAQQTAAAGQSGQTAKNSQTAKTDDNTQEDWEKRMKKLQKEQNLKIKSL